MKEFRKFRTKDVSYLFQAPNGVPGDITRVDESNVEPAMLVAVSTVYAQAFGIPMAYVAGGISQFQTSNVAADFAGVLVREVPGIEGAAGTGSFTPTVPYPLVPQGLCVRGYVSVLCAVGTPARGGTVYVQTVASGGVAIGAFRADGTNGGNAVALSSTQAEWASDGVDAFLNAELRIAR
jgi:hypothetical protein